MRGPKSPSFVGESGRAVQKELITVIDTCYTGTDVLGFLPDGMGPYQDWKSSDLLLTLPDSLTSAPASSLQVADPKLRANCRRLINSSFEAQLFVATRCKELLS